MSHLKYRDPSAGTWSSAGVVGQKGPAGPQGEDGPAGKPGGTGMPVPDADTRYVSLTGSTLTGDVSMGTGHKVINVAPGIDPGDAATIGQITPEREVPLAVVSGTPPTGSEQGDLWVDVSGSALSWDTNWQIPVMMNGWSNYLDTFAPASYRKLPDGRVMLRGLIKHNSATTQQALFNLPKGYGVAADQRLIFNGYGGTSVVAYVRVDIRNYTVTLDSWTDKGHGDNVLRHLSLDGIVFWPGA